MKVIPTVCCILLGLGSGVYAAERPADSNGQAAAPTYNIIRGVITKVDAKTIIVGTQAITLSDTVVVVQSTSAGSKEVKSDALAVGQDVSVRIDDTGVAVRIEIH